MKRFIRFRDLENELNVRPVSRLIGISDTVNDEIQLFFEADTGAAAVVDYVDLSVTNDNEKAVIEAISKEINFSKDPIIIVADDHTSDYIHTDLDEVVEIALASSTDPV
jgi:hypothetical protein